MKEMSQESLQWFIQATTNQAKKPQMLDNRDCKTNTCRLLWSTIALNK